ncbi:MAG: AMP-binding protein [Gammaproteobacteria bacterium]
MQLISLSRIAALWSREKPDAPAVSDGRRLLSWAELEATSNQLARDYAARGVGEGDFVTIGLPNGVEFVTAVFAIWKLGATPQPISSALTALECSEFLALVGPRLVLGASPEGWTGSSLPVGHVPDPNLDTTPLPEKTSRSMRALPSGGSTGKPKLIVSMRPATFDLDDRTPGFGWHGTTLIPGPLYHQGPFMWGLLSMMRGGHMIIMPRFDPMETLRLIDRNRVDSTCLVPTMMQRMWMLPSTTRAQYDISSMRNLWHLGAPCGPALKRAFLDWFGPQNVWELYGATEGLGMTVIRGDEWLARPGSVGRPAPGCEMKVVDEQGSVLPPGADGEIFIRPTSGPGSTYRYVGGTPRGITDGWESLGDIGHFDADGYLYIVDRRTDMILCGGANIYPAEIEATIETYPGVRSAAVIGLPHEDLGNRIHAIVDSPEHVVDIDALREYLQHRLSRPKWPHTYELADSMLRNDAGKLQRTALRAARLVPEEIKDRDTSTR